MKRFVAIVLLTLSPALAHAQVFVEDRASCLAAEDVRARIGEILTAHRGAEQLTVSAIAAPGQGGVVATLRVVSPPGEVILARTFELAAGDCSSAPQLFAAALDTFLGELPRSEWGVPEPAPAAQPALVVPDATQVGGLLYASVDSRWSPVSADIELGGTLDVGAARHRLTGSAALRVGLPQEVGSGHFVEAYALLGMGWRHASRGMLTRVEARTIERLVGPGAHVDDLLQETFIIAFNKRAEFDAQRAAVTTWLYGIAANLCRHHQRSWRRRTRFTDRLERQSVEPSTPQPDAHAEASQAFRLVAELMGKLPMKQREVFALYEVEGLDGPEIAQMLGIPVGTVWTRLHHARKSFKKMAGRRLQAEVVA